MLVNTSIQEDILIHSRDVFYTIMRLLNPVF